MKKLHCFLLNLLLSSALFISPAYALDSETIEKNNGSENAQINDKKSVEQINKQNTKTDPAAKKTRKGNKHKNLYNKRISRQPYRENTQH